jgi:hypothetical protein
MLIAHGVPDDGHHRRFMELAGRPQPEIAYLGAANGDQRRWYERVADTLARKYGARCTLARTVGTDDRAPAAEILERADILYLAGGDVSALSERVHALSLGELIRRRHQEGALLVGVSAGAIGLTRFWIEFDGDRPSRRFPCVGALPFAVDCHDEESDWEELRALLEQWAHEAPGEEVDAFGIPAGGALEIDATGRVTPHGPAPRRFRLENGKILDA